MTTLTIRVVTLCLLLNHFGHAQQSAELKKLIPQNLLKLVHAPEVHQELQLTAGQVAELEKIFDSIDGLWFRSRVLPPEQQREVIEKLEKPVLNWASSKLSAQQNQRLKELNYQSQGVPALLNAEVISQVQLTSSQLSSLGDAMREVAAAELRLAKAMQSGSEVDTAKNSLQDSSNRLQKLVPSVLEPSQQTAVGKLLGKSFDTKSLRRIYPMAPELVSGQRWINSQPLTLKQLRGKIVLVHFYAFQCHNCHANFKHYTRWHEKYADKGVVVLGIQTPETTAESQPDSVQTAAKDKGLKFPILFDGDKKNWDAWSNTMWPTVYVVDQDGYLRHWWQGELNWQGAKGDQTIEDLIEQLQAEKKKA